MNKLKKNECTRAAVFLGALYTRTHGPLRYQAVCTPRWPKRGYGLRGYIADTRDKRGQVSHSLDLAISRVCHVQVRSGGGISWDCVRQVRSSSVTSPFAPCDVWNNGYRIWECISGVVASMQGLWNDHGQNAEIAAGEQTHVQVATWNNFFHEKKCKKPR